MLEGCLDMDQMPWSLGEKLVNQQDTAEENSGRKAFVNCLEGLVVVP